MKAVPTEELNVARRNLPADNELKVIISGNLKKKRLSLGIKAIKMAKMINVHRSVIFRAENGSQFPSIPTILKMLDFYEMTLEEVCGIKEAEMMVRRALKCKGCEKDGKVSTVTPITEYQTLLYSPPHYDERGTIHQHDKNKLTSVYRCSNGHQWKEETYENEINS